MHDDDHGGRGALARDAIGDGGAQPLSVASHLIRADQPQQPGFTQRLDILFRKPCLLIGGCGRRLDHVLCDLIHGREQFRSFFIQLPFILHTLLLRDQGVCLSGHARAFIQSRGPIMPRIMPGPIIIMGPMPRPGPIIIRPITPGSMPGPGWPSLPLPIVPPGIIWALRPP